MAERDEDFEHDLERLRVWLGGRSPALSDAEIERATRDLDLTYLRVCDLGMALDYRATQLAGER